MKKRRNIPTIPIDFYSDGGHKEKYRGILYNSILEGVEQSLQKNKDKFIMARVDDGKYLKDIEPRMILRMQSLRICKKN